ncbi:MAG: rRNA maturation RNase YbeY [Clostridiales bacterium]|jgi:probable rRNA maturation factor|nr:rRNA maturation RNase YbeY [Clostridiales bacterium]
MRTLFNNKQKKLYNLKKYKKIIKFSIKKTLKYVNFNKKIEIGIIFVDNNHIKDLNCFYRNKNKETDVLSFPMLEFKNGNIINSSIDYNEYGEILLGDTILSLENISSQYYINCNTMEEKISFLIVHSTLHLLGYDHDTACNENIMFILQKTIFQTIKKNSLFLHC